MLARPIILGAAVLSLVGCSSILGLDSFTEGEPTGSGGQGGAPPGSGGAGQGGDAAAGSGGQASSATAGSGGSSEPVTIHCKKNGDAVDLLTAGAKIDGISSEPFFLTRGPDGTIYVGALVRLPESYTWTLRLLSFYQNDPTRSYDIDLGSAQAYVNAQIKDGKLDVVTVTNQALIRHAVEIYNGGIFGPDTIVSTVDLPPECVGTNSPYGFQSAFIDGGLRFGLSCLQRAVTGAPTGVSLHYGGDDLEGQLIETRTGSPQEALLIRSVGYSPATGNYLLQTGYEDTAKGSVDMRIGPDSETLKTTRSYETSTVEGRETSVLGLLPLADGSGMLLASVDAKFNSANLDPDAHFGIIQLDGDAPWSSPFVKDIPIEGLSSLSKFSSSVSDDEYIYASGTRIQLDDQKNTVTYSVFEKKSNTPAVLGFEVYKAEGNRVQNSMSLALGTGSFYVAWQEGDTDGQMQAIRAAKIICSSVVER